VVLVCVVVVVASVRDGFVVFVVVGFGVVDVVVVVDIVLVEEFVAVIAVVNVIKI
jgi:hypothetical protein